MASVAYCSSADLLLGSIPTPAYISKEEYINLAADEINMILSAKYVMPVADPTRLAGAAGIFLKQANIYIASGRLILAAAAGGSDDRVHAYGNSLLRKGQDMLHSAMIDNDMLDDLERKNEGDSNTGGLPVVHSHDESSLVESFYDQFDANSVRMIRPSSG